MINEIIIESFFKQVNFIIVNNISLIGYISIDGISIGGKEGLKEIGFKALPALDKFLFSKNRRRKRGGLI